MGSNKGDDDGKEQSLPGFAEAKTILIDTVMYWMVKNRNIIERKNDAGNLVIPPGLPSINMHLDQSLTVGEEKREIAPHGGASELLMGQIIVEAKIVMIPHTRWIESSPEFDSWMSECLPFEKVELENNTSVIPDDVMTISNVTKSSLLVNPSVSSTCPRVVRQSEKITKSHSSTRHPPNLEPSRTGRSHKEENDLESVKHRSASSSNLRNSKDFLKPVVKNKQKKSKNISSTSNRNTHKLEQLPYSAYSQENMSLFFRNSRHSSPTSKHSSGALLQKKLIDLRKKQTLKHQATKNLGMSNSVYTTKTSGNYFFCSTSNAGSGIQLRGENYRKRSMNQKFRLKQLKKYVNSFTRAPCSGFLKSILTKNARRQKRKLLDATSPKTVKEKSRTPFNFADCSSPPNFTPTLEEVVKFRKRKKAVHFNIGPEKAKRRNKKDKTIVPASKVMTHRKTVLPKGYWRVDRILQRRKTGQATYYLIKWVGK